MELTVVRGETECRYEAAAGTTLLQALETIKQTVDPSLTFRSGCRSGICGCCTVTVDGNPVLACEHRCTGEEVRVEPLAGMRVVRDLVVDTDEGTAKVAAIRPVLVSNGAVLGHEDALRIDKPSDCIMCHACYSVCPVLKSNSAFLGPFVLTKAWRYAADVRHGDPKPIIDAVQAHGVWECILCGDCAPVCPVGINPRNDIALLRTRSMAMGYSDPAMAAFGGGFGDMYGGFGGGFDTIGPFGGENP